jgi:hypothetical protein
LDEFDYLVSSSKSKESASESSSIPTDFWNYCEKWSPKFSGIQSCLLSGVLCTQTESLCLELLMRCLKVKVKRFLVSSASMDLLFLLSYTPWVVHMLSICRPISKGLKVVEVFEFLEELSKKKFTRIRRSVRGMYALVEPEMKEMLPSEINSFLNNICDDIVDYFFPECSKLCYDMMLTILQSPMKLYYPIILRMVLRMLMHKNVAASPDLLQDIVSVCFQMINSRLESREVVLLATDVVQTVVSLSETHQKPIQLTHNPVSFSNDLCISLNIFELKDNASDNLSLTISSLESVCRSMHIQYHK